MPPPLAALLALAAAASATAAASEDLDIFGAGHGAVERFSRTREARALAGVEALPGGCLHGGRWFVEGASVAVRVACLRCRCARGALSCARTACRAPPDPPPGCHLRHRRDACCPELHCPDGVTILEHSASARLDDDLEDAIPASAGHVCVEDGAVFGAGSALSARAACEQCYCLAGRRRCVRPRCLPPPPGCRARPAPGACCPQRYYCDPPTAAAAAPDNHTSPHDCEVDGAWVSEGARVQSAEAACAHCFCLRGGVRCQPLACAPPLAGCAPVTLPGQCCPHMYRCNHSQETSPYLDPPISHNALVSARNEDRSLDTSKPKLQETTTKILSSSSVSTKSSSVSTKSIPTESSTKTQHVTSKVKRKTNDAPPGTATQKAKQTVTNATVQPTATTKTIKKQTTKLATTMSTTTTTTSTSTTTEASTTASTEAPTSQPSTAQPDGTVRIMINGTINCTAELSHSPLNRTANETDHEKQDPFPRIPFVAERLEAHTSSSVDIITDRNVNGGFDENETFTINVTSSLRTNHSHTTAPSLTTTSESVPKDMSEAVNISKKNKEDYEYDYAEPTLPPSLPNLKIIPFVAADAVVDEDTSVKDTLSYPALEREDKFPVYYPSRETEPPAPAPFATRREDAYDTNPVFPPAADAPGPAYAHAHNHLAARLHELTVSAALDTRVPNKSTKPPSAFTKFQLTTPEVNLFSPPIETEGGFIPKGPGIIDEYYAVYPSTQVPPSLPHLTTSMQLDTGKGECYTHDGRLVPAGASLAVACSVCACAWGRLQCTPRVCPAPPGCRRRPASASGSDLCCGDLLCDHDNKTTTTQLPELSTRRTKITLNVSKVPVEIPSDVIPFDPPPDRREPVTDRAVTDKDVKVDEKQTEKGNDQETTTTSSKSSVAAENGTRSNNNETVEQGTSTKISTPSTTTEKSTTAMYNLTDKLETSESAEVNDTSNQSQEYEDEEDDEGFSFGSVLKLLLSDSYDATATPPPPVTPAPTTKPPTTTTTAAPKLYTTTRKILPKPTIAAFIPMPNHHYVPPKKAYQPNTINRIDHLVLGEATAIRKPTPRPVSATPRPATTSFKPYTRPSSPRPVITTRHPVTKMEEHRNPSSSVSYEVGRPPAPVPAAPPGAGAGVGGLLKLAGCNIYGQMYRVGRIIIELSTPCEECRCTELGVTCRPLPC